MFPRLISGLILLGLGIPLPAQNVDEEEEIDECAATQAFLDAPSGVALDGEGNVYIADRDDRRIRRVDAVTQRMAAIAGNGRYGFEGDGGPATAARMISPSDVAVDAAGNAYIADTGNHRIRKIDAVAGTIATIAGSGEDCFPRDKVCGDRGDALDTGLFSPSGIAVGLRGDVYVADTGNHRVRRIYPDSINPKQYLIDTVAGGWSLDAEGTGYSGDGGPADAARLNEPQGVTVDWLGNIYIADTSNHRVRKVDRDGIITTIAGDGNAGYGGDGGPADAAQLNNPQGVAADRLGNVYIADTDNHRIRKVDRLGTITTIAGTGAGGFRGENIAASESQLNRPARMTAGLGPTVYIADQGNRRIRKIDRNGVISTVAGRGRRGASGETAPAVCASVPELSFALPQDAAPASQTVVLYVARGNTAFEVRSSSRWLAAAPSSGRLVEDEKAAVEVTVNPLGLRVGMHRGVLYIRSEERVTTLVAVVLEVLEPLGPAVSESGVVNAASMRALGEPGLFGPRPLFVAPGSMVAVLGRNFTDGRRIEAAGFPLPTSLSGVTVKFNGLEAPLFAMGPNRIDAQLPSALGMENLETGLPFQAAVTVETAEASSYPRNFHAVAYAPGIFTASGDGSGQAAALFAGTAVLAAPLGYSSRSRPARAGDLVEIYATGLGPAEPPIADGMNSCEPDGVCAADFSNVVLRRTAARPRVRIGNAWLADNDVLFYGLAPALVGVNVIIARVPPGRLASSDAASLTIAVEGRESPRGVTIAVE